MRLPVSARGARTEGSARRARRGEGTAGQEKGAEIAELRRAIARQHREINLLAAALETRAADLGLPDNTPCAQTGSLFLVERTKLLLERQSLMLEVADKAAELDTLRKELRTAAERAHHVYTPYHTPRGSFSEDAAAAAESHRGHGGGAVDMSSQDSLVAAANAKIARLQSSMLEQLGAVAAELAATQDTCTALTQENLRLRSELTAATAALRPAGATPRVE